MLAAGRFDCAAVLTSSSKNSHHLSSPLGTKLTPVRASHALARYILFFRLQRRDRILVREIVPLCYQTHKVKKLLCPRKT
jgi:hypothetical protein